MLSKSYKFSSNLESNLGLLLTGLEVLRASNSFASIYTFHNIISHIQSNI